MAGYTFPMDVSEEIKPERIWSDDQQQQLGTKKGYIELKDDEHIDFYWATKTQVRNSVLYDEEYPEQRGLVMLENKKAIILDCFERLKKKELKMLYPMSM